MFFSRHFKITIFFVLPVIAAFIFGGVFSYKQKLSFAGVGTTWDTPTAARGASVVFTRTGGNPTNPCLPLPPFLVTIDGVSATVTGCVDGTSVTVTVPMSASLGVVAVVIKDGNGDDSNTTMTVTAAGSGPCSGTGCSGNQINYSNDIYNPILCDGKPCSTGQGSIVGVDLNGEAVIAKYINNVKLLGDILYVTGANFKFNNISNSFSLTLLSGDKISILPENVTITSNTEARIDLGFLSSLGIPLLDGPYVLNLYVPGQEDQQSLSFEVAIDNEAPEIDVGPIKSKDYRDDTEVMTTSSISFKVTDDGSGIANLYTYVSGAYGITTGPDGEPICPPGTKLAQVGNELASAESNVTMSPKVTGVNLGGVSGLPGENSLDNNPLDGKPNNKPSSSGVTGVNLDGVIGLSGEKSSNVLFKFGKHSPLSFYMDLLSHAILRVYYDTESYVPYDKLYKFEIEGKTHIQLEDSGLVYAVAMGPGGEPISIPNTEEGNFVLLVVDSVTGEKIAEIRVSLKDGKLMSVAGDFIPDSTQFSANDNVLHVYAEDAAGNKSSESLSLSSEEELEIVIEKESDPFKISLKRVDAPFAVSLGRVNAPFGISLKRTSEPPPFMVDIYEDVPIISISDLFDFRIGDNLDSDFGNLEISIREVFDPKNIPIETPADIKILRNTSSGSDISLKISTPSRAGAPVRSDDSSVIDREVIIKGSDKSDLDNLEFYIRESYNEPKNDDEPIAIEVKKDDARNNEIAISDNKFLSQQSSASLYSAIVNWFFPKQQYPAGHNTDISAGWADYEGNWSTWPMDHSVNYSASWVGVPRGKTAAWPSDHHVAASNLGNFK